MAIKRVDMTTGEVLEEYYSKKFWKCYRKGFLDILRLIKNQQLQVFVHICENVTTSKNEFIGSYEKIAKAINKAQNANTKVARCKVPD